MTTKRADFCAQMSRMVLPTIMKERFTTTRR